MNQNPYQANPNIVDEWADLPEDLMVLSVTSLQHLSRQSQRVDALAIAWVLIGMVVLADMLGLGFYPSAKMSLSPFWGWVGFCLATWLAGTGIYLRATWSRWLSYGLAILLISWPYWWTRVLGIFCVYTLTTTAVVFDYPRFSHAQLAAARVLKTKHAEES